MTKKITPANYKKVTDDILVSIKNREREEKEKLEKEKLKALEEGRKIQGAVPQPIISPLYLQTLQTALYNGLINESDFCKRLSINADKMSKYFS